MISLNTSIMTARDAANAMSELLDRASSGTPTLITRNGKAAAVVIDPATWDTVQLILAREAADLQALAEAAQARAAAGLALSGEQAQAQIADWLVRHNLPPIPANLDPADHLDLDNDASAG